VEPAKQRLRELIAIEGLSPRVPNTVIVGTRETGRELLDLLEKIRGEHIGQWRSVRFIMDDFLVMAFTGPAPIQIERVSFERLIQI
jgi:hypothetical protein